MFIKISCQASLHPVRRIPQMVEKKCRTHYRNIIFMVVSCINMRRVEVLSSPHKIWYFHLYGFGWDSLSVKLLFGSHFLSFLTCPFACTRELFGHLIPQLFPVSPSAPLVYISLRWNASLASRWMVSSGVCACLDWSIIANLSHAKCCLSACRCTSNSRQ